MPPNKRKGLSSVIYKAKKKLNFAQENNGDP